MKCCKCGQDAKKKERDAASGRCPKCSHPFVCDPARDGMTDAFVQRALARVTGNGTFHFLFRHLVHELRRRKLRQTRKLKVFLVAGLALAGCVFVGGLLAALGGKGMWPPFILVPLVLAGIAIAGYRRKSRFRSTRTVEEVVRRWLAVNPSPLLVKPKGASERLGRRRPAPDLGGVSFDRVLVCDRHETVDFLLANQFHLHYTCPVVGGTGYPPGVFEDMVERLRKSPRLEVYVLHDLTPRGLAYPRTVQTSPRFFAGATLRRFVDLGLLADQRAMFAELQAPLDVIEGAGGGGERGDVPGLSPGHGVEVTVFRPEALIRLLAQSFEERVPFHLLAARRDGDGGSSGSGGGDGYG